jgi:dienelactone hydrolase
MITTLIARLTTGAGAALLATCAMAQQQGPEQTAQQLEVGKGPFTVAKNVVAAPTGYGGGTVYYPTNSSGKVGLIVVAPGFTETESYMEHWAARLASNGFAVVNINTKSIFDAPPSRSKQMQAALTQTVALSKVSSTPYYNKIDGDRLGAMGHSMGGGGTLELEKSNPKLKAAIPAAPWSLVTKNFPTVTVPTMIIACQGDIIAPVSGHADRFWKSFNKSVPAVFAEYASTDHYCPTSVASATEQAVLGKLGVAWFKRFMDGDTRYTQFIANDSHLSRFLVNGSF